ncbi:MAG: putative chloroplast protein Ycf34 [Phormidesmis priestleyi Ana]|uniref:Putative chloroplast protein Ycf34 n=1 Tax=Phormidesmis priestleyi Ana TaxID=1666911 RepID=A0A0P8C371_9CYAN|nr:MAG: putative chloroplast protein Ycf34 [Phormidesmis priestleyi Ana]
MCICVNCHYVDSCITYHAVEANHQQPHLTEDPVFEPNNPTINANITLPEVKVIGDTISSENEFGFEYDVVGCDSFTQEMGKWAKLRPGEAIPT